MRTGRAQIGLMAILFIVILRVAIGVHFVREGEKKIVDGGFSSAGFLGAAKGPFAPLFQSMLADWDGKIRLGYDPAYPRKPNPKPTLDAWNDYKELVALYYGFGNPQLEERFLQQRKEQQKIVDGLSAKEESTRTEAEVKQLEAARKNIAEINSKLEKLRLQNEEAESLIAKASDELTGFMAENEEAIANYFAGWETRLEGSVRDTDKTRAAVNFGVDSLRAHTDTVRGDLMKTRGPWFSTIDSYWTNLQTDLNGLALPEQKKSTDPNVVEVPIVKPFEKSPMLSAVDSIVPWFDLFVGISLIVGLFTRFSSLLAAGFLASIVATQLPGVPGAQDSIYQAVECAALLALAGIGAGRFAGLDYFVGMFFTKKANRTRTA